jgi:hypothetical protein
MAFCLPLYPPPGDGTPVFPFGLELLESQS